MRWSEAPEPCREDDLRAELDEQLTETLAAIMAGESIPADGLFFHVRRGDDFVVRRKCGAAEVARVAIADIGSAPIRRAG